MAKARIIIDRELCKECHLCIHACKKGLIIPSTEYEFPGLPPGCFKEERGNARGAPCARSPVRISLSRFIVNKVLMQGNKIIGEAAIRAGCLFYAGYPITPQNELPEYMAENLRRVEGGVFIQAESEIAAIHMVAGASAAGARSMTSSSSPGISLKQEGISSLAACELPAVIVNMMRGGPGLGNICPAQGDYFQATRGGGHGDYRTIVLGPASAQELADLTMDAFDLADEYRTPVMILADGMMGQMMEPVIFKEPKTAGLQREVHPKGRRRGQEQNHPGVDPRSPGDGGAQLETGPEVPGDRPERDASNPTKRDARN